MRTEVEAGAIAVDVSPRWASPQEICELWSLGRVPYREAARLQEQLAERRKSGELPDMLLLLEHPPVITLGRNARREHILSSAGELAAEGIEVVETNRGGEVTFHGPGQLIGYPILDLSRSRKDVGWYLRTLEQVLIEAIQSVGVAAERRQGLTGVWVQGSKVASIGVHISRWVTTHGFALNVTTDLRQFRHIVPCGMASCGMTSLEKILSDQSPVSTVPNAERRISEAEIGDSQRSHSRAEAMSLQLSNGVLRESLMRQFGELFGRRMEFPSREELERRGLCPPPM